MGVSEGLVKELDLEMASTRRTLERIPEDKLTWKPHEKSMALGRLAGHLAELPGFGVMMMQTDSFNVANRQPGQKPTVAESQKHALEVFDGKVAELRAALAGMSDADFAKKLLITGMGMLPQAVAVKLRKQRLTVRQVRQVDME